MIRNRWFIGKWRQEPNRAEGRVNLPDEVVKAVLPVMRELVETLERLGHHFLAFYNVGDGQFYNVRNLATAFCSRSDAEDAAFELLRVSPDLIGRVEVMRLRIKRGPNWLLRRVKFCAKCGTCSIYTRMKPSGYSSWPNIDKVSEWECSEPYDCFRRSRMNMGKPGVNPKTTGPIVMLDG